MQNAMDENAVCSAHKIHTRKRSCFIFLPNHKGSALSRSKKPYMCLKMLFVRLIKSMQEKGRALFSYQTIRVLLLCQDQSSPTCAWKRSWFIFVPNHKGSSALSRSKQPYMCLFKILFNFVSLQLRIFQWEVTFPYNFFCDI